MSSCFPTKQAAMAAIRPYVPMLQKYFGRVWRIRVHENLGWHATIEAPYIHVHYHPDRKSFMAMMSEQPYGHGMPISWGPPVHHKNPVAAVIKMLKQRRDIAIKEIEAALASEAALYAKAKSTVRASARKRWTNPLGKLINE